MPVAKPYSAKALRNGFPFVPNKVRADFFFKWTTLGGTTDTNVGGLTPEQLKAQIAISFENAYRLYWFLVKVNFAGFPAEGEASGEEPYTIDFTDAANNESGLVITGGGLSTYKAAMSEPKNRSCKLEWLLSQGDPDNEYTGWEIGIPYAKFPNQVGLGSSFFGDINIESPTSPQSSFGTPIVRMYNGDTSNEANFVGYGITSDWQQTSSFSDQLNFQTVGAGITGIYVAGPPDALVSILSYANPNEDIPLEEIDYGTLPIAVPTGLDPIPVLICIYSQGDDTGGGVTAVVDPSTRLSKYEYTSPPPGSVQEEGIRIDSIELYTAP